MKRLLFLLLLVIFPAAAQTHGGSKLVVVMPFENVSDAPGIDWIGESFPEVLGTRLGVPGLYILPRADRLYALDRVGIPATSRPSRATIYQLADHMDVDYVVIGRYTFDGTSFTARAQVMDVRRMKLSPESIETGALTQLLDIQNALAWNLLRALTSVTQSREAFLRAAPPVRLDALENYIRGVVATESADRIRYLRQATRLNPDYAEAQLLLGRTFFDEKDYEAAIQALGRVPAASPLAAEANFYLGLAAHFTGDHARAEQAFEATAARVPLIEVYNNLGVAQARRGKRTAANFFQRAAAADSRDPDYRFNLGIALYRNGDTAGAIRQLKEAVALRSQDTEARSFLDQLSIATAAGAAIKVPLERIKRNYDETSYRQLAREIHNAREARFVGMAAAQHASAHVDRGRELLAQGVNDEAETEFREAVLLDPTSAEAHLGLARILEARSEFANARSEVQVALQLKATPDAYLLLAMLDVRQNRLDAARENVDRAARLDPAHPGLDAARQAIAARQSARPSSE